MPTSKRPAGGSRRSSPARRSAPKRQARPAPAPAHMPDSRARAAGSRRFFAVMVLVLCVAAVVLCVVAAARLTGLADGGAPAVTGVTTDVTFASARGTNLHATITLPDYLADEDTANDADAPLVVMCHGFTGNRGGDGHFQPLADTLAASGIASIRVDFAGNGESEEPFTAYTLQSMYDDIESAISYMRGAYPITQVGLLGHSMGGRVVSLHLSESIAAAALWSPANGNGLNGLEFIDHDATNLESMRQAAVEAGSYDVSGWNVTISADFVNQMDTSHPCDFIREYTGALLVAFNGGDTELLSQTTIDDTLQAAKDRGTDFVDLSGQFANANHNYQSAAGDEAETAAISESIEGQTAQFFIDALLPADDADADAA